MLPENLEGIESPMNFVVVVVSFLSIASVMAWVTYAFSPAARLRRRARKTVRNFTAAVEDLKNRSLSLRGALLQSAAKYKDDVRIARLRSIPIDELRNHRKGLLLQPLKQAGLYTLADVRGWSADRFGSLRGVGPSSATNIATTATVVINDSWNKPVPHPCVPFSTQECPIIEAIYRTRRFELDLGGKLLLHQKEVDAYTERLRSASEKTKFIHWLTASLNAEAIKAGTEEAERIFRELDSTPSSSGPYDVVTSCVEACANLANNHIETENLVDDFNTNRKFYEEALNNSIGKAGAPLLAQSAPGATEPVSMPVAAQPTAPTIPIRPQSFQSIKFTVETTFTSKKFQGSHLWVPAGKDVTVRGYTVPGGLLYLGHLDLSGSTAEPSVIDPTLPIAGPTSCHERLMSYWPSYSSISPEARAAYLGWLSSGKSDPQADIGYVFLYFYGLEKRLFTLPSCDPKVNPEVDTILNEIERLAGIYGDRGTFGSYSGSLLDYIEAKSITLPALENLPEAPDPKRIRSRRLSVKLGVGVYVKAGKPLPAEWAYSLYALNNSAGLNAGDDPLPDLRRKMFNHIYKERFDEGITSSKTGPKITADHHFGNASLIQTTVARIEIPLPDVTMNQQTMEEIQKVGSEASVVFRKFSTFATENPQECQSLSGLGILPVALWPSDIREMYEAFRSDLPKVMKFQELPGYPPSGATLKRFRLNNFVEKLATVGLGMDPDSRLGVELPGPDDPVVVFAARDLETRNTVSKHFNGAALLLQLASIVASSSEGFSDKEASTILNYLDSEIDLPECEKQRLAARLAVYRQYPPAPARLRKQINGMAIDIRESIGNFLVHVAAADGTVDPSEVRTLEDLFRLLGLEKAALYSKIHSVQTQGKITSTGRTIGVPGAGGIQFDVDRIAALRSESAKISTILDKVFESTEELVDIAAVPEKQDTLLGLDPEHADLLRALLSKSQWTRSEAEQLCSKRSLMIDGAFERINDAAFDRFDSAILEGDEPIDVNCDLIVKETA
jgi:tellurite resistance protein